MEGDEFECEFEFGKCGSIFKFGRACLSQTAAKKEWNHSTVDLDLVLDLSRPTNH